MKQFPAIAQTFILTGFSLSALSLFAVSPAQAAYFRGLGFLDSSNPYRSSSASGISADGSVVIGSSNNTNGLEAFRWTQSDGMVSLANLDGGNFSSGANDVSDDGSVVVGVIYNRLDGSEAFRWTQSGGMVGLGFLSGDSFNSQANEVSADGSVVVGSSDSVNGHEAFRWTQSGGMVGLGFLSSDNFLYSSADGVSADGSVIVGKSNSNNSNKFEAFRWTQSGGMVGLGFLSGDNLYSSADGVSADGSVIVGQGESVDRFQSFRLEPFRWTQADGMVGLGFLTDDNVYNNASAVSADGSVVVGGSDYGDRHESFVWTQTGGMLSLKDTLIGAGLDLSDWHLDYATDISADGLTIVGYGYHLGHKEAWVANLSPEPVPEPLTILGSIVAIAFAAGFERKFGQNKSDEKDPDN